jgi:lipoprotein-anchoring transpeptidase ErfK/SrfK
MSNNAQATIRSQLSSPGKIIEAAVWSIRKYLLRHYLWRPISTAPHNQDLELRVVDEDTSATVSFPCRRTNAGVWINADLGTRLQIEPIAWRLWQKARSLQPHTSAPSWTRPHPLLQRAYVIRAIGAIFVVLGAAAWGGVAQSQVLAINLRSDGGLALRQVGSDPESNGTTIIPARLHRQVVNYRSAEPPGTVIIDTPNTYLYFILGGGQAIRYGVGIGREGFTWSGIKIIERKTEWPDWIPPADMLHRQPYLPRFLAGGPGNPLGARAVYLAGTVYRIHGTNAPETIGKQVSSGCIRMLNEDVIDLYNRTQIGTKVVVLPMNHIYAASSSSRPLALTALPGVAINRTSVR